MKGTVECSSSSEEESQMPEKSNSDLSVVSSYDFDYEQQQISIQKKKEENLMQHRKNIISCIHGALLSSGKREIGVYELDQIYGDIFSRDLSEDLKSMGYSNMIELNDDPSNNLEVLRLPDDTFIVKSLNLPTSSETLVNSIISQEKTKNVNRSKNVYSNENLSPVFEVDRQKSTSRIDEEQPRNVMSKNQGGYMDRLKSTSRGVSPSNKSKTQPVYRQEQSKTQPVYRQEDVLPDLPKNDNVLRSQKGLDRKILIGIVSKHGKIELNELRREFEKTIKCDRLKMSMSAQIFGEKKASFRKIIESFAEFSITKTENGQIVKFDDDYLPTDDESDS